MRPATFGIVSAGTNGPAGLVGNGLEAIRARADALHVRFVIWVLPIDTARRRDVMRMAATRKDDTVAFIAGSDGHHPKSYSQLANAVRAKMSAHSAAGSRAVAVHAAARGNGGRKR